MSAIRVLAAKRTFCAPSTQLLARRTYASASTPSKSAAAASIADVAASLPKVEIPRIVLQTPAMSAKIAGMTASEWLLMTTSLAKGVALTVPLCAGVVGINWVGGHLRDADFVAGWLG